MRNSKDRTNANRLRTKSNPPDFARLMGSCSDLLFRGNALSGDFGNSSGVSIERKGCVFWRVAIPVALYSRQAQLGAWANK